MDVTVTQPSSYSAGYDQPGDHATSHNTTVVIRQPGAMQMQMQTPRQWSTDVFGCCDDTGTCCYGAFCGGLMAMGLAQDLDESACVPCLVPGGIIALRTKMRLMNNIQGSIMEDCCIAGCCPHCALCQMAREMDNIRSGNTMRP